MNENAQLPLILLSAGGTGGHMFPALALAQDLSTRGYRIALATDSRGRKFAGDFPGGAVHILHAGTLGAGLLGKVKGIAFLGLGIAQAFGLIARLKPAVVVGFGGYPSVPAVYAAQRRGIPTIIHEQNAVLGRANVFLAHKAGRIALSMAHAAGLDDALRARAVFTGNPVRSEIAALFAKPYPALHDNGVLRIAVFGGSLGANIFADVVPAALALLPDPCRARLEVTQQCRPEDMETARAAYERAGIRARLAPFFDDMPAILAQAHLVISRSGASTVAELTTAGRPAVFVPYPHHKDQQQLANARTVADAGGGWVMTQDVFTAQGLLARIEGFLQNPGTLFRAAENARGCGRPDAARRLGNLVTEAVAGWDKDTRI